jgi:hypothetical protein
LENNCSEQGLVQNVEDSFVQVHHEEVDYEFVAELLWLAKLASMLQQFAKWLLVVTVLSREERIIVFNNSNNSSTWAILKTKSDLTRFLATLAFNNQTKKYKKQMEGVDFYRKCTRLHKNTISKSTSDLWKRLFASISQFWSWTNLQCVGLVP